MKKIAVFLLFCLFIISSSAKNFTWKKEQLLWDNYSKPNQSSEQEIRQLHELIAYYSRYIGDYEALDTLVPLAISKAKKENNFDLLLETYDYYFAYLENPSNLKQSKKYLAEVERLASRSGNELASWYVNYFKAMILFSTHEFKKADSVATAGFEIANKLDSNSLKIQSLLQSGECNQYQGNIIAALQDYLRAQDILKDYENPNLELSVAKQIERLYFLNDNNAWAKKYANAQLQLVLDESPIDTIDLMNAYYSILEIKSDSAFTEEVEDEIKKWMFYSKKRGFIQNYINYWSMLRSKLIEADKFEKLYQLYNHDLPEELEYAKNYDPELYLRLRAYFFEYEGHLDSASYYWNRVMMNLVDNKFVKTHMYMRYTQFLMRIGKINEAYENAKLALRFALESKYEDFEIRASGIIESIEVQLGLYKEAYQHASYKHSIEADRKNIFEQNRLGILSLQHEYNQRDLIREKEEEKENAENRLKFMVLIAGLIAFLVVSAVIFRQYRQTRREKERSDELLLNILPEDTAEELKNKGFTTAREYENVTVLFTDIVGFTKIAERLSAEELVKEIDTYFRAFDDIMGKHGLEKIKTVGDAYVAVGGMPLKNKANAVNVLAAAVDMLQEVEDLAEARRLKGEPYFELRVGLNTGSVIAGVVGSKKFQFDIWGDTVNVAARMEQNSVPGKINISGSTYDAVKHVYKCTARGKLEAKNKGKISMFFVETDFKEEKVTV